MVSGKTPKKTIQKKTRVSKATVKRGKQTRVSRIPSPQMHKDTRIQTRTRSRSRTRPPIDPDFGMRIIGYEDDQRVRRLFVVLPIHLWHTGSIAFYQTTGSSNAGFNVYQGSWVPTIGVLSEPIPELRMDVGHIVKMGHINDVLMDRHVPAWLIQWCKQNDYFGVGHWMSKPLGEIQLEIQGIQSPDVLNKHMEEMDEFDRIYRFLHNYFLTWEQVQLSAQLSSGFWHLYPELHQFALTHDWHRETNRFVQLSTVLPPIEVDRDELDEVVYENHEQLNAKLNTYDAFLDANEGYQYYRDRRPEIESLNAMYPRPNVEWRKINRIVDGLHLYMDTKAIHFNKKGAAGGALGTQPILLIGSSQMERWNLCKTRTHCINAGVGGMKTSELFRTSFLKSLPEPPIREIVFYCGSVDIMRSRKSNHKIYQTILTNVKRFLNMMLEKYPEATIKLIGIIQTPRLSLDKDRVRLMNSVNATWQRQYRAHARVVFVNVNPRLTNPKCFMEDGVHLSEYGYMNL